MWTFLSFLFSANYSNNSGEQDDEVADDDFVLLYEDSEGDQMLVGDIPWEYVILSSLAFAPMSSFSHGMKWLLMHAFWYNWSIIMLV